MIDEAIKAGKAAARARDLALKIVKPGAKVFDVAEQIEKEILRNDCGIAFPCNISINEIAAHDSAMINDTRIIKKGDVVKIDVGAHVNGIMSDTARTVVAGEKEDPAIVKCVEECMERVLEVVKPGANINSVGEAAQKVADAYGFSIVKNLVGHGLGKYEVHTGISIPNYRNKEKGVFKNGDLIAVEPYVTSGYGSAIGISRAEIYSLKKVKSVRIRQAKEILDWVVKERKTLPFCKRWLSDFGSSVDFTIKTMVNQGILEEYKVLREVSKKVVAQRENTILLLDEPIVTTKA